MQHCGGIRPRVRRNGAVALNGIVVLDKPAGISSAAAVDRVKRALDAQRAGHGGTLDPIATGVLVICLGEATKIASYLLADAKSYIAELTLGIETDTLDRTGNVVAVNDASGVSRDQMEAALRSRLGDQQQLPPMFSAIKQRGVRLYKQARSGAQVERVPRPIRIDHLQLLGFDPPRATISVACSKGTYIRSLISDLGRDLGCGAHLAELRRTRSGAFSIDQAHTLEGLGPANVLPMESGLALPVIETSADLVPRIRAGLQLTTSQVAGSEAMQVDQRFQLQDEAGRLVAIAHVSGGRLSYDRVFRPLL